MLLLLRLKVIQRANASPKPFAKEFEHCSLDLFWCVLWLDLLLIRLRLLHNFLLCLLNLWGSLLSRLFLGLLHGWLITRLKLQPFVVTLCGLLIYRGIARFYTKDGTAGFSFGSDFPMLEFIISGRTAGIPHSVIAFAIVAVLSWFLLHRTVFGRHLFAVGKNAEAARYSGINSNRVIIAAYMICIFLTGISAVFFAMYTRSVQPSSHGNFYELYAIAAAVLGGFSLRGGQGSIVGVVLGVILLQELQNLVNLLGIPSSLNFAVMGGVILVGVIADTQFARYREARRKSAVMSSFLESNKG